MHTGIRWAYFTCANKNFWKNAFIAEGVEGGNELSAEVVESVETVDESVI